MHVRALSDYAEKDTTGKEFSYGAKLWPAALGLEKLLIARQSDLRTLPIQSVLEVGAGVGLSSLVAAKIFSDNSKGDINISGGVNVVATDISPFTLKLVEQASIDMGVSVELQVFDIMSEVRSCGE